MTVQQTYSDVIAKTEQMVISRSAQKLAAKPGTEIVNVTWEDAGQGQSERRKFLVQAAGIAFGAGCALCCGCQTKTPSDNGEGSPADASRPLSVEEQGLGSGQGPAESIEQRVIEIVAEQMGIPREKIKRESRFKEDLGADSLDTVELVMELEEEFNINIPDDVAEKTRTIGQAVERVTRLLGNHPVPPRKKRRRPQMPKPVTGNGARSQSSCPF